jgi:hypothetical protein
MGLRSPSSSSSSPSPAPSRASSLRSPGTSGRHPRRGSLSLSVAAFPPVSRLPIDYQPGDLLFFAGRDFVSRAIAFRTCTWRQLFSHFWPSHVGICANYRANAGIRRTLLFESTTFCDSPCFLGGRRINGVQAHLPSERVLGYPGRVWRLRLRRPLNDYESLCLSEFCQASIGQPYNMRRAARLASFAWRNLPLDPIPDSWFCSDFAIEALKTCSRVGQDHDPEDFPPGPLANLVLHSGEYWPIGKVGTKSFLVKP